MKNRFYAWGRNRVVFTDVDTLMNAINDFFAVRGPSDLGDHSPVLAEIDPTCDDLGSRRMGHYLRTYLDALTVGSSRETALARASADYRQQFGEDRVVDFQVAESSRETPIC